MKMTPSVLVIGGLVVFAPVIFMHIVLPWITISEKGSDIYRPRTPIEETGRDIYVNNGCTFCHTQFVRNIDWDIGAQRVAQSGDYIADSPHLIGTERTGPDLSQEGGEHPDDWHMAHFMNPRFTRPESIMPSWEFLGKEQVLALIAYKQSLGFKMADDRVARQKYWKAESITAFEQGPDKNVQWLHAHIPEPWTKLANPYLTAAAGQERGHRTYQGFCIGCHGPVGDGMGPAQPFIYPPPLNFTILKDRGVTGGILYYQIMNGITGTAMPYFKKDLESEKIWDVGNYVAVTFIGQTDAHGEPRGIDAAYEPVEGEMIYYVGWLYLVVMSLIVSIAAFIWGLRSGQFSDQDRARYLPLGEDLLSQPIVTAGRVKHRAHSAALLFIVAMGLIAFATALVVSIHHR